MFAELLRSMQKAPRNTIGLRPTYHSFKRMIHVMRGADLWQGAQIECEKVWLGNAGACWCVCPQGLSASSIVYSFFVCNDTATTDIYTLSLHDALPS